jgi:hypothetical protein
VKPFDKEDDVRRVVARTALAQNIGVFWVENKAGGTAGFPDVVLIRGRETVFAELKVGERKGDKVVFEARNAQRIGLRKIRKAGGIGVVIIGIVGSKTLFIGRGGELRALKENSGVVQKQGIKLAIPHFYDFGELIEINNLANWDLFRTLGFSEGGSG